MPTVLRIDGYRVVIYPNDHRPSHVHIIKSDCEAVFELGCPNGPSRLRENYGFPLAEVNRIAKLLDARREALCRKWREIHGDY